MNENPPICDIHGGDYPDVLCHACFEDHITQLANERDTFAKRETELLARLNKANEKVEYLLDEIRKLKACPICHQDFIGKQPHINCGDCVSAGESHKQSIAQALKEDSGDNNYEL